MEQAVEPEEWEFEKCKRFAGPNGHTAITRRQRTKTRGLILFYWQCVDCGQKSKTVTTVLVDNFGKVL